MKKDLDNKNKKKHKNIDDNTYDTDQPLGQYLSEIGRIDLLTKEEEINIGKRIAAGDEEAINQLVKSNLRFVVRISKRYMNKGLPLQDLINEGNIGLIKAAEKFDYTKGCNFTTYAVWCIRQSILKALNKQTCIIHLPKRRKSDFRIMEDMLEENQELTVQEAADSADIDIRHYNRIKNLQNGYIPIDIQIGDDEKDGTLADILSDNKNPSPEDNVLDNALKEVLITLMENLTEQEKIVLTLKYGILGHAPHTLKEISEILGLSRERVRQIRIKALAKLKILAKRQDLKVFLN